MIITISIVFLAHCHFYRQRKSGLIIVINREQVQLILFQIRFIVSCNVINQKERIAWKQNSHNASKTC